MTLAAVCYTCLQYMHICVVCVLQYTVQSAYYEQAEVQHSYKMCLGACGSISSLE